MLDWSSCSLPANIEGVGSGVENLDVPHRTALHYQAKKKEKKEETFRGNGGRIKTRQVHHVGLFYSCLSSCFLVVLVLRQPPTVKTCDCSNKLRTILPTDQFRALFNNTANNVTLPLGALKVHEKSIRGSRVDWSPETLKNMFRGFVPFPVINS